jgi:hypothetical protein
MGRQTESVEHTQPGVHWRGAATAGPTSLRSEPARQLPLLPWRVTALALPAWASEPAR